jgi:ribosomal-protein-alanine N-acetyltransferase
VRLETERLVLREMAHDDVEPLLGVFGDERVMTSFASAPFDRAAMERWVERNLAHQRDHGYGLFTLIDKADGTVIGDCGLEHMDIGAELGYDLRADRWGRGLATEAAIAVRDFAFATLRLPRLVSLVRVGNQRSRRVAEKVGMTRRGDHVRGEIRYWLMELSGPGS